MYFIILCAKKSFWFFVHLTKCKEHLTIRRQSHHYNTNLEKLQIYFSVWIKMFLVPWQYNARKNLNLYFYHFFNSTFTPAGLSVWPWLGQAAGHTSLMLFQPTFIIIIHGLNDKAEIKYEIKVGNNLNNIVDTVQRHKVQNKDVGFCDQSSRR